MFISGAGVPGLTLAILLGQAGLRVAVADAAPLPGAPDTLPPAARNRTSAFMKGSVNILARTGAWADCLEEGAPLCRLSILDRHRTRRDEKLRVDFQARDIGLAEFGVNMPNEILRAALVKRARKIANITLLAPAALDEIEVMAQQVAITLATGQVFTAALAVGADGRHSKLRERAGIAFKTQDYDQAALTCLFHHSRPHENTSLEFHYPGGPFTTVPLPGNTSSLVWVERGMDADALMRLRKAEFTATLQKRTEGLLGRVSLATAPSCWPLISCAADRLTAPRVALMAEAAHVLHPMGAQGLNLSLRDAAALAELIIEAKQLGLDPGSTTLLDRYERARHLDIQGRRHGTDMLARLLVRDNPLAQDARRAGLKLVDSFFPLKAMIMKKGLAA